MAKSKNTSNLWSHLRIHHCALYDTAQNKKQETESQQEAMIPSQPTIQEMFQRQRKWPNTDEKSKQFDFLSEMIVTDNQPFTVVSDAGFKRLMAAAEPRYSLKSEKYYRTEMLKKIHHKVVDKVKALI